MKQTERLRFTCSTGFLLIAAALLYLDGQGLVLRGALACALHEGGHGAAIALLGGRVRALRLTAVGAEMELDPRRPLSYGRELIAALAGPAVNLLLAWFCVWNGWYLFAGMNICLGLLNLLPICPLDGGRALFCALNICWPRIADRVVQTVSTVFSGALLGLGWAAWRGWGNLTLLCAALWLMMGILRS